MVTTSYPAVSGRQRRHLHGADRRVGGGARPRGPRRRALAPARHARAARNAASAFISTVRAVPVAERVRLRGGAARGRARCAARRTGGGAAGARRRLVRGVARRAQVPRDGHARPLGGARRSHRRGGGASAAAGRQPARIRRLRRRDVRAGATRGAAGLRRAGAVTACSADLAQRAIALGADPATHRGRALRRRHRRGSARSRSSATSLRAQLGVPDGALARLHRRAGWSARRGSST